MDDEVFCVDCKVVVKLNLFSKDHKRHEMKLMADLLEDRKKECYKFLELRKQKNNFKMSCFMESDKDWKNIEKQAASLKQTLNDHTKQAIAQLEMNRLLGCKEIDAELSKKEKSYLEFKNKFIDSENDKLVNLENIIENLDEISLRKFSLILPDLPKTTPCFNAELEVKFQPASETVIDPKHFFRIIPSYVRATTSFPQEKGNITQQRNNDRSRSRQSKHTTPVLAVAPTCSAQALSLSNYNQINMLPQETLKFSESLYNLGNEKGPYMISQDFQNLYAIFKRSKKIKFFKKITKKFIKVLNLPFEPCCLLAINEKDYIIDLKQKFLFISWVDENSKDKKHQLSKIALNSCPNYISFAKGKRVTISSDKIVQSFEPSNNSLRTLPGTSNIGRILRAFDCVSMLFVVVENCVSDTLLYIVNGKKVNEYDMKLKVLNKEYLIDVNKNGNVCIFNTVEKIITVLNSNFQTLGYVHVQQIESAQVKDMLFDNKDIIYITSLQDGNVAKVLRIPFIS